MDSPSSSSILRRLQTTSRHMLKMEQEVRNNVSVYPTSEMKMEEALDPKTRPKILVTVIGCGAFGTAMSCLLARNGHTVKILVREPEKSIAESINKKHRNSVFMTQYTLDEKISATADPHEAFHPRPQLVIHAIPVQFSYNYLQTIKNYIPDDVIIVSISKGIDSKTLELMSDVLPRGLGRRNQPLAFLSGPSFAEEIIEDQPTAVVVASFNPETSRQVQLWMSNTRFRIYTSNDVVGVLMGGALKNIIAIAAGCAEGLGYKKNTLAALVTRGNAEIQRLAVAKGADRFTLAGLSGHGDLVLTCYGSLSRNRTVGQQIAKGKTLQEIMKTQKSVAEGVYTTKAAVSLGKKLGFRIAEDLPIINAVHEVLEGRLKPQDALELIMNRPLHAEN